MATTASKKRPLDDLGLQGPPSTAKRPKALELAHVPEVLTLKQRGEFTSQSDSDLASSLSPSTLDAESDSDDVTSSSPSFSSASNSEHHNEQPDEEDESTSSSSLSSSSSSSARSGGATTNITTLSVTRRPPITSSSLSNTASDLCSRLSTFLPTLAAANDELELERAAGTLRDRDIEDIDDEGYIEMNLGLGVLEERKSDSTDSGCSSDSESSEEEEADDGRGHDVGRRSAGRDILETLMGHKKRKVEIQVVDAG